MNYFEKIKDKSPHERRAHAAQIAAACTVIIFVGWLAALGVRFATEPQGGSEAQGGTSANQTTLDQTQVANVVNGVYAPQDGSLEVATDTSYGQ